MSEGPELESQGRRDTKVADQICSDGIWSPLPIRNVSIFLNVEAKYFGTLAELFQATFSFFNCLDPFLGTAVSIS